eukprot:725082_1
MVFLLYLRLANFMHSINGGLDWRSQSVVFLSGEAVSHSTTIYDTNNMANLIMRKARIHSSRLRPCGIRRTHPNSDRFLSVYYGANFGYCLLRPPHGRFSPDCVTVARWMNILACFMCSFSEKYSTADTTGAELEFISRMLEDGESADLIVLSEMISQASG